VTLVIGEAGSGKTTLIRTVLQRQPERVHTVHLTNPTLSREEFVETLGSKFGLSERATSSKASMLAELDDLLQRRRDLNEVTVLIVDEAQSVPLELLEEIRLLANIEADDRKLMLVILAGQPELAHRLEEPNLRQLKQRVALRCQLQPLTAQETARYIAGRITAAGGVASSIFTREAVALMHAGSNGLPRTINVLADNALLGGFAAGLKPVRSQTVREVCRDFGLTLADGLHTDAPGSQRQGSIFQLSGPTPEPGKERRVAEDGMPPPASPVDAETRSSSWLTNWSWRRRASGN
jgi:general secretion pathway protein A